MSELLAAPWPARKILQIVGARAMRRSMMRGDSDRRVRRLEQIVSSFAIGYQAALRARDFHSLETRLAGVDASLRGFAYEGAAMAVGLLDILLPGNGRRTRAFVTSIAEPHVYMAHVGAGWASARLGGSPRRLAHMLDPLLWWLAVDGFGFHDGFFHRQRAVRDQRVPAQLAGYERRAYDQGLGRCLWFTEQADGLRIASVVEAFPVSRRSDLWSGIALAATYAGGVGRDELVRLREFAQGYAAEFAQGAAFGAEARERAGNPTRHSEEACQVFAKTSAARAAATVRRLRPRELDGNAADAYDTWRRRIGAALIGQAVEARELTLHAPAI